MSNKPPISVTQPELAKQAVDWNPDEVTEGSSVRRLWRCQFGHEWQARVIDRIKDKTGCPYCSNHKLLTGFNDFAHLFPDLALEASGWEPSEFLPGNQVKRKWECSKGHTWEAAISTRTKIQTKCPYCTNRKVLSGFNDLSTTHPSIAIEAHGWDPESVTYGAGANKKWKCKNGHVWAARVAHRASSGSGCPTCSAQGGFNQNEDGWLYFLRHEHWGMLQIGITNQPKRRLTSHKKLGWIPVEIRGPMDGLIAREWETSILRFLRDRGIELGPTDVIGRFDGFSESWKEIAYPANSLEELIEAVRKTEEGSALKQSKKD